MNAILSQIRLRVDADLTDNVSTTIRLINERVWGLDKNETNNGGETQIDLDLAYATLKEFLYSPLTLTVGRQELRYGNAMVIGKITTNMVGINHVSGTGTKVLPKSLDDLSLRKSFDAVKAVLNYDPLLVDLVYSRIDQAYVSNKMKADLYGINASYAVSKQLLAEAYGWLRSRRPTTNPTLNSSNKDENLYTAGARLNYSGLENLNLSVEGALQFGNHLRNTAWYANESTTDRDPDLAGSVTTTNASRNVHAFATQAIASYALPKVKFTPVVNASYTYWSGDKWKSNSKSYKGWDPMYEDMLGGTLINKLLYNNFHIVTLGVSAKPMDDVKVSLDYYYAGLNLPYTEDGAVVILNNVSGDPTYTMRQGKTYLGSELEMGITYDYTEDVQFALQGGSFIPCTAFNKDSHRTSTQLLGSMKVTF